MRTLLAESFPPEWKEDWTCSPSGLRFLRPGWVERSLSRAIKEGKIGEIAALTNDLPEPVEARRTFFGGLVLASLANLTEVGVDGMVIATPGASYAENADNALEPGMTGSFQCSGLPDGETLESQKESPLLHESS